MHRSAMRASLVLSLCAISIACASSNPRVSPQVIRLPPEVRTVYEYPSIPAESLACLSEPPVSDAKTDVDFALWTQSVREAGADCRAKLDAIRRLVATWGANG
jgi:hypothetical protein